MSKEKQYYSGAFSCNSIMIWGKENIYDFMEAIQFEDAIVLIGYSEIVSIRKSDRLIERSFYK